MMNILITGGCGFIGSHFINYYYQNSTHNIVCIDAMYYCASENNIDEEIRNSERFTLYKTNINDYDKVVDILKKHSITHIIHFAAQSHVDNSFNDSIQYTYDNVKGTHTILEAIKNTNLKIVLIHISTDEVYGESDMDEGMKTEDSILCPTNPYAASKAAAEMYVKSYIKSFGLKAIITRGNNVYGNNQYPEKLIPKFITLLKSGKKCTIHGDGSMLRSFIHVDDVCTAIDKILHLGSFGEIYNIGSDEEISVLDVTEMLIRDIHNTTDYDKYIEYIEDRPFNDKRYFISNEKIKFLGWEQKIDFNDGLKQLIKTIKIPETYGYIIYCTENNNKWEEIYKKIREKDNSEIVLIVNKKYKIDNSKYKNIIIEQNDFDFFNVLIPYYYYFIKNYFSKGCILNDNINLDLIQTTIIDMENYDFKILIPKDHITDKDLPQQNILNKLDSTLSSNYNDKESWVGGENLLAIVKFKLLDTLQTKYEVLTQIANKVGANYTNVMENVIGFLLCNEKKLME